MDSAGERSGVGVVADEVEVALGDCCFLSSGFGLAVDEGEEVEGVEVVEGVTREEAGEATDLGEAGLDLLLRSRIA